jgi:hypothetical protein
MNTEALVEGLATDVQELISKVAGENNIDEVSLTNEVINKIDERMSKDPDEDDF